MAEDNWREDDWRDDEEYREDEMTLGEVHRYVWEHVVLRLKEGECYYPSMKTEILADLYTDGKIDDDLFEALKNHSSCVLCYLCSEHGNCHDCPLTYVRFDGKVCGSCDMGSSLYAKLGLAALNGGKDDTVRAAECIRDVNLPQNVDGHYGLWPDDRWDELEEEFRKRKEQYEEYMKFKEQCDEERT